MIAAYILFILFPQNLALVYVALVLIASPRRTFRRSTRLLSMLPLAIIVCSFLAFFFKVSISEKEHAKIVKELEAKLASA